VGVRIVRLCSFFLYCSRPRRDLHSFPTRRSSDLRQPIVPAPGVVERWRRCGGQDAVLAVGRVRRMGGRCPRGECASVRGRGAIRSEEHTSELQSQSNLVCRLLLEKKKKKNILCNK